MHYTVNVLDATEMYILQEVKMINVMYILPQFKFFKNLRKRKLRT